MSHLPLPAIVLLALAGTLGAMLRYLIDVFVTSGQQRRAERNHRTRNTAFSGARGQLFPWGILTANTLACLLMATAAGYAARIWHVPGTGPSTGTLPVALVAFTVGFCGSLSTMSTFVVSLVAMLRSGQRTMAFVYAGASVAAGLSAGLLGLLVAGVLATGVRLHG